VQPLRCGVVTIDAASLDAALLQALGFADPYAATRPAPAPRPKKPR